LTGYDPFTPGSGSLFRFSRQAVANNNPGSPNDDVQTYSIVGEANFPPQFCSTANPDPGTPSLPTNIPPPYYILGSASEVHDNSNGVNGIYRFDLRDSSNRFRVLITLISPSLFNFDQMNNPAVACDVVTANFANASYVVEKPVGTRTASGVITCMQMRNCNNPAYLYGCSVDCSFATGPGCSNSASNTPLPSGASVSASPSEVIVPSFSASSTETPSSTASASAVADASASPSPFGGVDQSFGNKISSWLDLLM
jgi:hypothetical protein